MLKDDYISPMYPGVLSMQYRELAWYTDSHRDSLNLNKLTL